MERTNGHPHASYPSFIKEGFDLSHNDVASCVTNTELKHTSRIAGGAMSLALIASSPRVSQWPAVAAT